MASKTAKENVTEEKKQDVTPVTTENNVAESAQPDSSAQNGASESMYTLDELVLAEKELEANGVIIRTALGKTEKKLFTMKEAKDIVSKFKAKEVK